MARYSFNNQLGGTPQNMSTAFKTITYIAVATGATTLRRVWIDEVNFGQDGLPNATDCQVVWSVDRSTADGTGTAGVPPPTETNDAAALGTYKFNYTAEPTVTATTTLLATALNQRQNYRWKVFDLAQALVVPAVNAAGIVSRAKSTTFASTVVGGGYAVE